MDSTLSEFIAHTGADPGLATDILEGQRWDLSKSLQAYYFLKGITTSAVTTTSDAMPSSFPLTIAGEEETQSLGKQPLSSEPKEPPTLLTGSPSKPTLHKSEAVDIDDIANKKLTRGISRATDNVNLVSKARNEFALDFRDSSDHDQLLDFNVETPVYTFTLPDLTIYPDDFVAFLEKDLIETSTLLSLEQAGRLNWWTESGACQRLWPLATTGDGNCLLHAASLGMWGFHDRLLTLRKALHAILTRGTFRSAIWRRWRWQQTLQNKEAGLLYSEDEWQKEWENLLRLSSTEPRSRPGRKTSCCDSAATRGPVTRGIGILDPICENGGGHDIYESLEEIHVLALAHVLRRPIIVVADTMLKDVTGEPFAPIPFGGVYLPLECRPIQCHRSPLVLTYDAAHFSALVAMEREVYADKTPQPAVAVIPLSDAEHQLLPLQYAVDPGEHFNWGSDDDNPKVVHQLTLTDDDKLTLLLQYLDVERVPILDNSSSVEFLGRQVPNGMIEIDKKSSGSSFESDDSSPSSTEAGPGTFGHKSKAAKQFQSVAKQFGSIGRSMSKKLKKNFGNFKLGRSNSYKETFPKKYKEQQEVPQFALPNQQQQSSTLPSKLTRISKSQDYILCAMLHTEKRHEYQEEMIKNYLHSARLRFEKEKNLKGCLNGDKKPFSKCQEMAPVTQVLVHCVNPWCSMYGTAATSYLCISCYEKQKEQEQVLHPEDLTDNATNGGTLYGIGRSRFYADTENLRPDNPMSVPVSRKPILNPDQTLYLSNSTFFDDTNTPPTSTASETDAFNECQSDWEKIFNKDLSNAILPSTSYSIGNCSSTTIHCSLVPKASPKMACRSPKCPFFGTVEMDFYCSQCHKEHKIQDTSIHTLNDHMRTTQI